MTAGVFSNRIGQSLLQWVLNGIGIKPNLMHLLREPLDVVRMTMSDRDHSMPSVQVEVFRALIVIDIDIFGANGVTS